MNDKVQAFDQHTGWFKDAQTTPWARLRYSTALANLQRHLPARPLRILDAGGGNGLFALPLAAQGHHVTIVDFSAAMLADAQGSAAAHGVSEHITTIQADLLDLPTLFPEPAFDTVICHMVVQYIDDVAGALRAIIQPVVAGGIVSVMGSNRYAMAFQAALLDLDLQGARAQLDATTGTAFEIDFRLFTAAEMIALLQDAGCALAAQYGVLSFCAYMPNNELKYDPAFFANLEQLEHDAAGRYPYYLSARFFHVVAHTAASVANPSYDPS